MDGALLRISTGIDRQVVPQRGGWQDHVKRQTLGPMGVVRALVQIGARWGQLQWHDKLRLNRPQA